jgi:phosphoserine / homoserine phosphotransferase
MHVVCLDLEGVLVPEIWINVSKKTGIEELSLTTRDISDYDVLMNRRLAILRQHGLLLQDIQEVIAGMDPLEGACRFLDSVRPEVQLVILSDTFEEFARPLMRKLGWPTLFCNQLIIDKQGAVTGYRLRQRDGKRRAVEALRSIGLEVLAAGDSYNDLTMIRAADHGALFRAPQAIREENPDLPAVEEYDALNELIGSFLSR